MLHLQSIEEFEAILNNINPETLQELSNHYQPVSNSSISNSDLSVENYLNGLAVQMLPYYDNFDATDGQIEAPVWYKQKTTITAQSLSDTWNGLGGLVDFAIISNLLTQQTPNQSINIISSQKVSFASVQYSLGISETSNQAA
jgi:hypothetical protein